jgi:putative ABC transport system permease protein
MRLRNLVWKELRERPSAMLTSGLTILLGVAAVVAIRHVTVHAEGAVYRQLKTLGANVLILPKDATLQDYYAADQSGKTLPEEHVSEVFFAGLTGVEKVTPKLSLPTTLSGQQVTLTGILPQSEFQKKIAMQSISLFSPKKHDGCKRTSSMTDGDESKPESLATNRSIEQLQKDEVVIGADISERTGLRSGAEATLFGETFRVLAVLPRTGTVDDGRVFAHLHSVQRLAGTGEVINAIELIACCEAAAGDLIPQIRKLLPDAKVVTISQVVETQVGINRLMSRTSWLVLAVLVTIGCATVAGAIAANVRERRREIGTLMALGATPTFVSRMFLLKALWLGVGCGSCGCLIGTSIAMCLGPQWAGVSIEPLPGLCLLAVFATSGLALFAAFWPARQAARLDPCVCFQEV